MMPKDKFDLATVENLKQAQAEAVLPNLPQMLEWIKNLNWPVAEPMIEVLLHYPTEVTPYVEGILQGNDDEWIYNCLVAIVPRLPFFSKLVLVNAVEQLATKDVTAQNEHIVEAAKQALQSMEP
ncbi:MAG: DUF5071 domain-containing protein [Solibacillus sp.]